MQPKTWKKTGRQKSKKQEDEQQCEVRTIECEHRTIESDAMIIESEVGIVECKNSKNGGVRVRISFCFHLECALESLVFTRVFVSVHECWELVVGFQGEIVSAILELAI